MKIRVLLAGLLVCTAAIGQAPVWIVTGDSELGFVATQQGSEFEGVFEQFDARIRFDPGALDDSRFAVTVTMDSVDTRNVERDETLRSADLFDVEQWPQARFEADRFRHLEGSRFEALGTLTIRNRTHPLKLRFEFDGQTGSATLSGEITISRLDYDVGQGEWADTTWIGEDVTVTYELMLESGS